MRLVVVALLIAAPVLAQSPTDERTALLAATRAVIADDDHVTALSFDNATHSVAIAEAIGARITGDGVLHVAPKEEPRVSALVRVLPPKLRGDSAFVHVLTFTTIQGRPFMSGTLMTLVRRNGAWAVSRYELTGIS